MVVNLSKKLEGAFIIENENIKQCVTKDKKSETAKTSPLMTVKTSLIPTKIEFAEVKSKGSNQSVQNSNGEE